MLMMVGGGAGLVTWLNITSWAVGKTVIIEVGDDLVNTNTSCTIVIAHSYLSSAR